MDAFLLSDIFLPGVGGGGGGEREGGRGRKEEGETERLREGSRRSASPSPVLFSLIGPGGGEEIGQRLGRASWAAFNWLLFLTGGESNRRASDKGWESERPNEETRGGGRREAGGGRRGRGAGGGRRGERGMKSSEGGSSTAKPKLPSEPSAPAAPAQRPPRPGARPGPARWGPPQAEAAGRGRGRPTWGAAQPGSPESSEPGSAAAAARRREPSSAGGGGERRPRRSPGLAESANIFQTTQTFLVSPPSGVSVGWNCSPDSRGAAGARFLPGAPRWLGQLRGPGTRGSRPSSEPRRRCSRLGRAAAGAPPPRGARPTRPPRVGLRGPRRLPQDRRRRINLSVARALPPPLHRGASPGGETASLPAAGGLLDRGAPSAAEGSLAPRARSTQPWGPGADRRPGSSRRGAGCCAGRAEAPGAGPAPPASPRGQRPRRRRNPGRRRRRRRRRLLGLLASAAAPSAASRGKGGRRGHRGAPADAPPATSRAAPPRGDEAPAVKMEVTCLLLLALIPFHCRGQGVYAMKNATFQITPDVIKESENIQLGQDLKLSCHVDAVPQEKVTYQWFKNGKPARMSKRLLVTRNDPELPAVTSSLELIDLHFSDYGTYLCVASFPGAPVPDLSVEVNISSETVPPTISVPKGRAVVTVREGSPAELQCEVRGKPRPPVLWSRVDKEAAMLPSGLPLEETPDGKLRLEHVSRDMSGTYRCQTARYNGFNVRPREAQVQLNVQFPPEVEPSSQDVRQALGRPVLLRCSLLRGSPQRIAAAVWRFKGQLLPPPPAVPAAEAPDHSELRLDAVTRDSSGSYECSISNDVGSATCLFQVSAKAYSPEFYFDTPNPTRSHKLSKNYSYVLQWTQREPDAVDPLLNYRLSVRQLNQHSAMVKAIPVRRVEKGQLLEYVLTDLRVPHSYEVRLTPYTTFGAGDMASRIIHYTEPINSPNLSDNTCHFEDEKICGYTQDLTDNFDWTRQNALTQNPKRSPNTGPPTDISGTPEGYYMFIETSRPRELGDRARLVSPLYNASAKFYCVSFFYHMYGKHIGSLNLLVRSRNKGALDTHAWSLSGNKGNVWQQAHVPINPSGPFQIIFEGVRGSGYLGDIAIDDVTLKKGECPRKQMDPNKVVVMPGSGAPRQPHPQLWGPMAIFLLALQR
uniref:MAM domain containing glycosylphosphatidylinositol anchor 1 n=1 Tax=Canis lupus familiaris TaxID=9615 RepID=A0A8C0TB86_CANLF